MSAPDIIGAYRAALAKLPSVGIATAKAVAGPLRDLAQSQWAAGETPFGDSFGTGVAGEPITLDKTGDMKASEEFVPVGAQVVCRVTAAYAKYQLKRGFLPSGVLPIAWNDVIAKEANAQLVEAMK